MADLISRAEAIKAVYYKPSHKMAIEVLKEVPAVDAVPVVRCKDCKWGEKIRNVVGTVYISCEKPKRNDWLREPDWYCADGERGESE